MLRKMDIHLQKSEPGPLSHTTIKINLKVKHETIKLLGENREEKLPDIGPGNGILDVTPKVHKVLL